MAVDSHQTRELDVREPATGFEPVPLYDVLDRHGCEYETEQAADDVWRIYIDHA